MMELDLAGSATPELAVALYKEKLVLRGTSTPVSRRSRETGLGRALGAALAWVAREIH